MIIWFWDGRMYASSESALPFENLKRYVDLTSNAWSNYALGNYPGFTSASALTYLALYWLSQFNIPGYVIEAIFFYIIFLISGVSIYQLSREFFPEVKLQYLLISVAYYWFSPFVLVNVWSRFLYNYMVFTALFPFIIWLFIHGLRVKKYIYGFYIGIASLVFSYASTSPPFDFLLWFTLGAIVVLNLIWLEDKENKYFTIKFLFVCFIIYFLFNLWWISQMYSYSASERFSPTSNLFFNSIDNLNTIEVISNRLGNLTDVFRLMHHDFYQNKEIEWVAFFSGKWQIFIEFGILMLIFSVCAVKLKNRAILTCCTFVFLGYFLMKGSSGPLGELNYWIYNQFPVVQLFRNPFEKFGFLVPVFLSPLIGYSFHWLFSKIRILNKISFIFLVLIVIFFGKPFLTKELFTYENNSGLKKSYAVEVPNYYQDANRWLQQQGNNFRVLALPLAGEGITYNWDYPFSGVESTNTLLNIPAISYNTTIPYYSDISSKMQEDFLYDPNFFIKAKLLNIKFVLLRADIDYLDRQMMNPDDIRKKLNYYETEGLLKSPQIFGQLEFWEIMDWSDNSIVAFPSVDTVSPVQSFKLISQESSVSALIDAKVEPTSSKITVNNKWFLPEDILFTDKIITSGYERDQNIFPFVSHLSTSKIYPFVRFKESLQLALTFNQKKRMEGELFFLGKRISEIELARNHKQVEAIDKALVNYQTDFLVFIKEIKKYSENPDSQYQIWKSQYLFQILSRHVNYFSTLASNKNLETSQHLKSQQLKDIVNQNLKQSYIIPIKTKLDKLEKAPEIWNLYKFSHMQKGGYDLVSSNKVNFETGDKFDYTIWVNGVYYSVKVIVNADKRLDLGTINLVDGDNEIALPPINTGQIISYDNYVVGDEVTSVNLENYDPSSFFYMHFNHQLPVGSNLIINQYHDNSVVRDNKKIAFNSFPLKPGIVERKELREWIINPNEDSSKTSLEFQFWNPSCFDVFCSKTALNDITIEKYLRIDPVLVENNTQTDAELRSISVNYSKINDSYYVAEIFNEKGSFILNLNQLYHPGWQLKIDGGIIPEHILVNSYANGWIINHTGKIQAEFVFKPDLYYKLSQFVSGISVLILSGIFFYKYLKGTNGKN